MLLALQRAVLKALSLDISISKFELIVGPFSAKIKRFSKINTAEKKDQGGGGNSPISKRVRERKLKLNFFSSLFSDPQKC